LVTDKESGTATGQKGVLGAKEFMKKGFSFEKGAKKGRPAKPV